jgi:hypothetical protein
MAKFKDQSSNDDNAYDDAYNPYPENNAVSSMDLTLGQEYAGGGMTGKQAKLGKLIIEGEGLQMLDLIVAANMALWFRAYEKYQQAGSEG